MCDSFRDYFYSRFPMHLATLDIRRPSEAVRERIMGQPSAVFFGGPEWRNVPEDLGRIPPPDRPLFPLALFMTTLTDQAIYTHFRDQYATWLSRTQFPKFGWAGFGPHNENPFKLLWAPEREQVVDPHETCELVPEFCRFLIDETTKYFSDHLPAIDGRRFFDAIRADPAYSFHEGIVVPCFKAAFENLVG